MCEAILLFKLTCSDANPLSRVVEQFLKGVQKDKFRILFIISLKIKGKIFNLQL
jgi:hypothetical protein